MVLASFTEGIGFLLLVPVLGTLQATASSSGAIHDALHDLAVSGYPVSLGGLLLLFLLLIAFRGAVHYSREQVGALLQHQLVDQLRLRCFSALLNAEWRWIAAGRRSDHANTLLTDVSRIGMGLHFGLGLLAAVVTMLAYLFAAFALSWRMTLLALSSGGLVLLLISGHRHKALELGQSLGRANRALQGNIQESLAGIKLVKILGNERRHLDSFDRTVTRLREQQLQFTASTALSRAMFQFGGAALLVAYLYVGLRLWQVSVPKLLTLVLIFSRLIPMLASAQQQFHHCLHALPALEETNRLLAESERAAEPPAPSVPRTWPIATAITLENITLRYQERERPALDSLTMTFPSRTTTAIMGTSGAGKSTLTDVLMGLLVPDAGTLRVDGEVVTESTRKAWRQSVAYVSQEVFLFNDSIRNNLVWGNADATEQDLRLALGRAAANFAFELPQGLDTVVGDGGVQLSGGERQRLALARALLKQPSLLILDEATSALDVKNEARIREAIEHLHGDLTVVIVGHRLLTLEHADQVLVLDAGKITARGSWTEVRTTLGMKA